MLGVYPSGNSLCGEEGTEVKRKCWYLSSKEGICPEVVAN